MKKVPFFAMLAFATGLLFSCGSEEPGNSGDVPEQEESSSSGESVSSSSSLEDLHNYCVYHEAEICIAGSYDICPNDGAVSDTCPYSSEILLLSSSVETSDYSSSSGENASSSSSLPPGMAFCKLSDGTCTSAPVSLETCEIFGGMPFQSCAENGSSSSSNEGGISSDSEESSSSNSISSSGARSSSSATEFFLNCALPTTGAAGVAISLTDRVTCNGVSIAAGNLTWSDSKLTTSWFSSPTAGTYSNITVTVKSGGGNCSDKTAVCGSIIISTPSSASGGTSSGSGGNCSKSGWCDYGANVDGTKNCSQMPTDDCCADGKIVSSESQCSTTPKFCNWGRCEGGSGWNCTSGGCFPKPTDKETCDGGAPIVSCCPSGTTPPSGSAYLCK